MRKIFVLVAASLWVGQLSAAGAARVAKPFALPEFHKAAALVDGIDSDREFKAQYAHIFEGKLLGAHRGYKAILRGIISNDIQNYRTALSILLNGNGFDRGIDPFTVVDEETRPVAVLAAFLAGASPFYSPSLVADLTAGVKSLNKAHVEKVKSYVDLGRKFFEQKKFSSRGPIAIMGRPLFEGLLKDLSAAGVDTARQASDGLKRAVRGINSLESNTSKSLARTHSDLGQSSDVTDPPIVHRTRSGPMGISGGRETDARMERSGSPSSDGSDGRRSPSSGGEASVGTAASPASPDGVARRLNFDGAAVSSARTPSPSNPFPPLPASGRSASNRQADSLQTPVPGAARSYAAVTAREARTEPRAGREESAVPGRAESAMPRSLDRNFNAVAGTGTARTEPKTGEYTHKSGVVEGLYYDFRSLIIRRSLTPSRVYDTKFKNYERVLGLYLSGGKLDPNDRDTLGQIFAFSGLEAKLDRLRTSGSKSLDRNIILKFES